MRELQITELDNVYGGVDDSLTVAGLTITGVRAGLTLGAVGAAVGAAGSVAQIMRYSILREHFVDKNQKKAFVTLFTAFVCIIAFVGHYTGTFHTLDKSGLVLLSLFVAFCAFPFYLYVKSNKVFINRLYGE